MTSAHVTSRPGTIDASAWGRSRITQCSGAAEPARSIARSSSGLYSMIFVPSMPQLADTTTLGRASSMRMASSWGANPPNTTECTAPSRAQASIAITASGTTGM